MCRAHEARRLDGERDWAIGAWLEECAYRQPLGAGRDGNDWAEACRCSFAPRRFGASSPLSSQAQARLSSHGQPPSGVVDRESGSALIAINWRAAIGDEVRGAHHCPLRPWSSSEYMSGGRAEAHTKAKSVRPFAARTHARTAAASLQRHLRWKRRATCVQYCLRGRVRHGVLELHRRPLMRMPQEAANGARALLALPSRACGGRGPPLRASAGAGARAAATEPKQRPGSTDYEYRPGGSAYNEPAPGGTKGLLLHMLLAFSSLLNRSSSCTARAFYHLLLL